MRMFHVELKPLSSARKGFVLFFTSLFLLSCGVTRTRITIDDFLILPNGKEILGNNGLSAFVFENTQNKITFQNFLVSRFNLDSLQDKDFWVTIDGNKYKLIVYENAELEKYFVVADFIITNKQPENTDMPSQPNFLALSLINANNEDCLSEQSIFKNIATIYLKNLKDNYLKL